MQRRATKFILNLPFGCEMTYKLRLKATNLLPISFLHEYQDLMFFFKMVNGLVHVNDDVVPTQKSSKNKNKGPE